MDYVPYAGLTGIDLSKNPILAPQLSFLRCNNYILNREQGTLRKRGGSELYSASGDYWGIGGYRQDTGSLKLPTYTIPVRHRRSGSTSYIEKFDWSAETWSAITQGASTSFDVGAVASFAQIGDCFAVFAKRPAKIQDISTGNINRLGGPAPTAAPTVATGAAGALTGDYVYCYTFRDSSDGWESSPSPYSATVSPSADKVDLSALETSCAREGVDKKRIYRTVLTGEAPLLYVAEINLATTTYEDNTTDANLGAAAPAIGDHDPPPTTCYIGCRHENRFWLADGTDLYFSHAYDGNDYQLEYFSDDRKISFDYTITGLASAPRYGGLLVFKPPGHGIDLVRGRTTSEFERFELYAQEGTNHHHSITVRDEVFCFWGRSGPEFYAGGQKVSEFADQISALLRDYITEEYDQDLFVWSEWMDTPEGGQFLWGYAGANTSGAMWTESGLSVAVPWVESATGNEVEWQVS